MKLHYYPPGFRDCALVAMLISTTMACSLIMMKVPRGLESPEASLPVKSEGGVFSNKLITFGPWATVDVDRDWTSSHSSSWAGGLIDSATTDATQGYRFSLTEQGKVYMRVECLTIMNKSTNSYGPASMSEVSEQLGCGIYRGSDDSTFARLHIAVNAALGSGGNVSGKLEISSRKLQIHAVFESEQGARGGPYGYRIADGDTNLAAIQTANTDKVWMAPKLSGDDRDAIAGALASIALFKSISNSGSRR